MRDGENELLEWPRWGRIFGALGQLVVTTLATCLQTSRPVNFRNHVASLPLGRTLLEWVTCCACLFESENTPRKTPGRGRLWMRTSHSSTRSSAVLSCSRSRACRAALAVPRSPAYLTFALNHHTKKARRVLAAAASRVDTATPIQHVMMGRETVCVSGCELFALACNHRLSISAKLRSGNVKPTA